MTITVDAGYTHLYTGRFFVHWTSSIVHKMKKIILQLMHFIINNHVNTRNTNLNSEITEHIEKIW
jgi:hypothetical protein